MTSFSHVVWMSSSQDLRQARTHLANVKVASFQEMNDCLHVLEWTSVKWSYINNLGYTLFEWMLH